MTDPGVVAVAAGWKVVEEFDDTEAIHKHPIRVHVMPDDGSDHVVGPGCWCAPTISYECPGCGDRVLTHRVLMV